MATDHDYRWNGDQIPQPGSVTRTGSDGRTRYVNKGVQRARKAARRLQAEARNSVTRPENRRQFARDHGYPRVSAMHAAGVFPIVDDGN
jgi:hypothetical protein